MSDVRSVLIAVCYVANAVKKCRACRLECLSVGGAGKGRSKLRRNHWYQETSSLRGIKRPRCEAYEPILARMKSKDRDRHQCLEECLARSAEFLEWAFASVIMRTYPRSLALAMLFKALMFILVFPVSISAFAEQLLHNPAFDGPAARGVATGWRDNSSWADVDVEYSLDSDARSGKSEHIHIHSVGSGAVQLVQPRIHLTSGQTYEVGIWAKGILVVHLNYCLDKGVHLTKSMPVDCSG